MGDCEVGPPGVREDSTEKGGRCGWRREQADERQEEGGCGASRRRRSADEHIGRADAWGRRLVRGGPSSEVPEAGVAEKAGHGPMAVGLQAAGRQAGPKRRDEGCNRLRGTPVHEKEGAGTRPCRRAGNARP